MPENSKALAELRSLEDRIATHTARLDQLQAASASRTPGFSNLVSLLIAVGTASAGIAQFLVPQRSANWAVALGLAGAAVCLAAVTSFESRSSSFDGRLARSRLPRSRGPVLGPAQHRRQKRNARRGERTVGLLVIGSGAALASVAVVGGVAISVFALLLSCALLTANRSHPRWAARAVGVATIVVALGASVSLGAWAGTYTRSVVRQADAGKRARPPQHRLDSRLAAPQRAWPTGPTSPSYEELCHTPSPFPNLPRDEALMHLSSTWTTVGALTAGCPGPVRDVGARGTVIASVGVRRGQLQSVGVADREHGLLLIGPAASAVWPLIRSGPLLSAPTHLVISDGDVYLVSTVRGTYVFVRQNSTTSPPTSEDREAEDNGSYVALSPRLAATWVAAMKELGRWLWPSQITATGGSVHVAFRSEDGATAAYGWCSVPQDTCVLHQAGITSTYDGRTGRNIKPEEVLGLAQQAP
jgi:hypothetical protein